MSLFGAGKKKEETKTPACEISSIKVLGSGCKFCREMLENAQRAVKDLNLNVEVEYITDMEKVMTYGVMSMPALVVNEKVAAMGKVLKPREIEDILQKMSV